MATHVSGYVSTDQVCYTVTHLRKPEIAHPIHEAEHTVLHVPMPDDNSPPSSPFEAALFRVIGKEIADHYTDGFHIASMDAGPAERLGKASMLLPDAGAFANIIRYLTNGPDADVQDVRLYCVEHDREPMDSHKLFLVAGSPAVHEECHEKPDTLLVCEISVDDTKVRLDKGQWDWSYSVGPESAVGKWHRGEEGILESNVRWRLILGLLMRRRGLKRIGSLSDSKRYERGWLFSRVLAKLLLASRHK